MKITNLNVRARLALGFGLVFLGSVILASAGWMAIRQISGTFVKSMEVDVEFATSVLRMNGQIVNLRRYEKDMVLNVGQPAKVDENWGRWQEVKLQLAEQIKRAAALAPGDDERGRLATLGAAIQRYERGLNDVYAGMASKDVTTAEAGNGMIDKFKGDIDTAEAGMDRLYRQSASVLAATKAGIADVEKNATRLLAIVLLVVAVFSALLAVLIARSITRPIDAVAKVSESLARGDLTQRISAQGKDELGLLMNSLGRTTEQLSRIVGQIKGASDAVGTAAREISQGHSDLSTRTEEQASSLEQTAASMEEMTATVSQNAENARKASQHASAASDVAARGGQAVATVVSTMSGISASSKKIADIIGVIDGIAFQTNILALNAAVEAARAGEQGRGFAVVASEVRSLAQRSAAAAKEIRQLISDSVGRIDAGSKQVAEAGKTMEEIVESVKRVNGLIAEISAASQEQSQSLTQVSDTVQQLEKVTQQNAAMVEQATAASSSLEEQAASLTRAVGSFKLADGARSAAPAEATRPAPAAQAQPAPAPKVAALPKRAAPATAELNAPGKHAKGKGGKAKEEGWEEF
jgi:methyl-accepting chemotaxis protein